MSATRDKAWYLLHPDPELEALEVEIDLAAFQVRDERYVAYLRTRERLERLGFDVSRFRPPPRIARSEQLSRNHIRKDEDIEAFVTAAKKPAPDPTVIRRDFPTRFTIR